MTVGAPDPRVGRATDDRWVLRAAVLRFAAMSMIPLAVVAGVVVFASHHVARELALQEAGERSQGLAERVAEPHVEEGLRHMDPVAEQRFGGPSSRTSTAAPSTTSSSGTSTAPPSGPTTPAGSATRCRSPTR